MIDRAELAAFLKLEKNAAHKMAERYQLNSPLRTQWSEKAELFRDAAEALSAADPAAGVKELRIALHEAKTLLSDLSLGKSVHNDRFPESRVDGPLWNNIGNVVKRCETALYALPALQAAAQPAGVKELPAVEVQSPETLPSGPESLVSKAFVHEGSVIALYGTNDKLIGWIDTHAWTKGRVYRDRLLPTPQAPVAEDTQPCDNCGRPSLVWFAPNKLWNRVQGGPDATDDPGGMLCPYCFIVKAENSGVKPTAWIVCVEVLPPPSPAQGEPVAVALDAEIIAFVRERVVNIQRNFTPRSTNRIEAEALLTRMDAALASTPAASPSDAEAVKALRRELAEMRAERDRLEYLVGDLNTDLEAALSKAEGTGNG